MGDAQRWRLGHLQLRREPRRQPLELGQDLARPRLERFLAIAHLHVALLAGQHAVAGEAERLAPLLKAQHKGAEQLGSE